MSVPSYPQGPRPQLVVHLSTSILGTACGRVAGMRRWDDALGTFVQDSAHLTLTALSAGPGAVVCAECARLVASVSGFQGRLSRARRG